MTERQMFYENLFVETEDGPFLVAKKCGGCGNIQFPQKGFCQKCLSADMQDVHLGQKGKLFTYTTTYGDAAQRKGPFDVGYIELPEGIRVFAPIGKKTEEKYEIGMEMELKIIDLWEEDGIVKTAYSYHICHAASGGAE